jgi:hypothetical protein
MGRRGCSASAELEAPSASRPRYYDPLARSPQELERLVARGRPAQSSWKSRGLASPSNGPGPSPVSAAIAKARGITTLLDNHLGRAPFLFQGDRERRGPLDRRLHQIYPSGHSERDDGLGYGRPIAPAAARAGPPPLLSGNMSAPMTAYLVARGLRTLGVEAGRNNQEGASQGRAMAQGQPLSWFQTLPPSRSSGCRPATNIWTP